MTESREALARTLELVLADNVRLKIENDQLRYALALVQAGLTALRGLELENYNHPISSDNTAP